MSDSPKGVEPKGEEPPRAMSPAEAKIQAALGDASFEEALQRIEAVRAEPDPAAPDPVVVLPDRHGEAIVAETEAAAVYVQPTRRRPGRVPQDTQTRVRVDAKMDPRRQPTERRLRAEIDAATVGAEAAALAVSRKEDSATGASMAASASRKEDPSHLPPSVIERDAAASRAGRSKARGRLGLVWGGGVFGIAVVTIAVWGLRAPLGDGAGAAASGPSGFTATMNAGIAPPPQSGGGHPTAAATMASADTTNATSGAVAPSATAAATESATSSAARTAPKGTDDPYADAAPPVRPSVTATAPLATQASSAEPAPSVAPAPSVVPTTPTTATASRTAAPFTVEKD
ncbi:MAG: hypothetical protein U0441_07830 [Polyangiaceae bacterium]